MAQNQKPVRLYFKSYIQAIRNSVGSNLFRNLYVHTDEEGDFDALGDGSDSCAFFVSAILVIFSKLEGIHGTVEATVEDLRESGWIEVDNPQEGDILVWEAQRFDDDLKKHIGFSMGKGRAVSSSWTERTPVEHDEHFGEMNRKITNIFRIQKWEQ